MAKTATLNIRTDPSIKAQAERIYQDFGITLTDAINIFLRKSIMEGGLPFDMREAKPNAATLAAMQETEDILSGRIETKRYSSARALFDELDAEADGDK
ncbi:MAG: type II toxin-antitoxin system RelB/DinJ family antitoxin [Clostridia bacterium]